MNTKSTILGQQLAWARATGREADAKGYLSTYAENLFRKLAPGSEEAFREADGNELRGVRGRPAKMAALHSSSALAVNFFDYWAGSSLETVAAALGLRSVPNSFRFEVPLPTGLEGNPPNLDVVFHHSDGSVIGVESKFCEWLAPKSPRKVHFKPKYFPAGEGLWTRLELERAQQLAEAMHEGEKSFRYLDAAQLLKHMLGLANNHRGTSSLYYIFYDAEGREGEVHRREVDEFANLIGPDMPFQSMSYQRAFDRLKPSLGIRHADYVDYLERRYFPGIA